MTVLVIAEHDHASLKPATYSAVTAAKLLNGNDTHVFIAGHNAQAAADEAAKIDGVTKVIVADDAAHAHHLAENIVPLVVSLANNYSHVVAPATSFGKNFLPRVAALLDVQQISDVIKIVDGRTFIRPIYAGNALATVQSADKVKVMTVRPTAFEKASIGSGSAPVEAIGSTGDSAMTSFVSIEEAKSERPELTSARVVISGGRGLGSKENFALLETMADKLGAALGASRAAVDAGFVPNDWQVGQTGKVVAPDLYIAIGISGAIQHLAGMKDSKVIVAINKDADAPIFGIADYGLVGDLFTIVPELTQKL